MQLVLAYDVNTTTPEGRRRLRSVAKICEGYGHRVQKSVFEITCDQAALLKLIDRVTRTIDHDDDSIRIYRLPAHGFEATRTLGCARRIPHSDPLII